MQDDGSTEGGAQEPSPEATGVALVVGLGASAGGLEALQEFFDHTPIDTGMAFVVVTHLPSGRVSHMSELLSRHTSLPIVEVNRPTRIEPDRIYLPPPGTSLDVLQGALHLAGPVGAAYKPLTIDAFFR